MKKKLLLIALLSFILFNITGCFEDNNLEGSNMTTTTYPVEYLVTRLYGEHAEITSIYPNGTSVASYELTEKQIKTHADNTDLFIYNGLTEEKEIAKKILNENKKLQIVDVSYGIKYHYGVEELWLSPNNYLMLANTVKTDLITLSSNKYAGEEIEKNYETLEEDLSLLDTELRNIAENAIKADTHTIVIAEDSFGFLNDYGFEIVNISNENNITSSIKNKFKNKEYTHILVKDKNKIKDAVRDLVDNYGATLVEVDTMETLTDEQRKNNDNYLSIMNEFITNIGNITLS